MNLPVASGRSGMPAFLTAVLVVSVLTIVFFPLFTLLYQYPAYESLLHQFIGNEASAVARLLGSLLDEKGPALERGSLGPEFVRRMEAVQQDAHYLKLRIYSPDGTVVYSSDKEEIGEVNRREYFSEVLQTRRTLAAKADRDDPSLEGRYLGRDLVEVYVPVLRRDRMLGVLELYYDIAGETRGLRRVLYVTAAVQFSMAALLLLAVLISVTRAAGYLADRQRVLEELRTLSLSDELTGLYNRRGFFVLAEQQIKIARRAQRRLLLVAADLDRLKVINDGYGHHEGDRALADAAQILRESFRESDIIGRIGGDEFLVLITDRPEVGPETLSRRLEETVARHNSRVKRPYPFSISAGIIAIDPQESASLNEVLVRADRAMYAEKNRRREAP